MYSVMPGGDGALSVVREHSTGVAPCERLCAQRCNLPKGRPDSPIGSLLQVAR